MGAHLARAFAAVACLLGLCPALAGCSSTAPAPPYVPYQGITIDSAALVGAFGCGTGPTQVYRYVATVSRGARVFSHFLLPEHPAQPLATGVFDCFADGVFESLPAPPGIFVLTIQAFTLASLPARLSCDSSPCVPPPVEAGALFTGSRWTTTCTATQDVNTPSVVAQCNPLQPFSDAEGGASADAPDANPNTDAASDAGAAFNPDAGSDADAGAADAPADGPG